MQVMSVLEELARLVLLAVEAMREAARFMSRPVESRPPSLPGRSSGPVVHVGATERFGAELRALRSIEVSPELVSDIETELRWGLIWHEFERSMLAATSRVPNARITRPFRALAGSCVERRRTSVPPPAGARLISNFVERANTGAGLPSSRSARCRQP